jgi:2-(1,2-epoxy-1,2-dihydrophenyl)acetyl-CoA isomerase
MSYEHIVYDVDRAAHIATVTLNKPERLNAIDQQDHRDILELCDRIQGDNDVWVVIWTGAGRGFCAGADVRQARPAGDDAPAPGLNQLLDEGSWVSRQGNALYGIDKPMIAAVNGVAAGAGFSLALCCDIRVGCENSRFVTVFQERNLPPEGGMSFLLSRIVGAGRALDLSLTSRPVEAEEAYRIGLLDRLVAADELLPTARSIAEQICRLPPSAVRLTKRSLRRGLESGFEEASHYEVQASGLARRASHDSEEAQRAFVEKRKPTFLGR